MIGFQENRANELKAEDGKLSGEVTEPILGPRRQARHAARASRSLRPRQSRYAGGGDGANDLGMIEAAGLGVAYHAKPAVAAAAHVRIDYGDLTALLYMQGYRREEFTAG